jgi:TPR repeat protein
VRLVQLSNSSSAPNAGEYTKELASLLERLRTRVPPIAKNEFNLVYKDSVKDAASLDLVPAIVWLAENEKLSRASDLFLRAAKLGDSYAMMKLGRLYLRKGTGADDAEGFRWLNQAYTAPKPNLEAGAFIADCYLSGKGTTQDVQKSEETVMPLANQGVVPAMTLAGRILLYKADMKLAEARASTSAQIQRKLETQANDLDRQGRRWWERAEKDDWNAAAHLGKCYEEGWCGVEKNEAEAEKRYKAGASHGNALSLFFYGLFLEKKPERKSEAPKLIAQAAEMGLPSAVKWCKDNNVPFTGLARDLSPPQATSTESAVPEFVDSEDSTTAVRIISTHQATPRQRRIAEKNALVVYRAIGQERPSVIAVDTKRDKNSKGAISVMNYDTQTQAIIGNNVYDLSAPPEPGTELKIGNNSSVYMGNGRAFIRTVRSRETSPAVKDVRMRYYLEGDLINDSVVDLSAKGDELPTFFPPRATDRFPITVRLAGENVTLQQLADRLSKALKDAGYEGKCSYYWLDDMHGPGFAIVTHIEHIQADGKPVSDQRWGFDLPRYGPLTLGSLLRALMHADPGHYRLIALVASRHPLIEKDTLMTPDQVVILNKGPSWLGDSPWKTVVATTDFHLIAYVYEFERKSRSDDPVLMVSSDLTAEQHLQSTGLNDDIKKELLK